MDEATYSLVNGCIDALYDLARRSSVNTEGDDIELVVQVARPKVNVSCQYYFVDHATRTLFWLHRHEQQKMFLTDCGEFTYLLTSVRHVQNIGCRRYELVISVCLGVSLVCHCQLELHELQLLSVSLVFTGLCRSRM